MREIGWHIVWWLRDHRWMIEEPRWQWRFRNITWRCYFDRHDLWRGCYWKIEPSAVRDDASWLYVYLCPLPCCVIRCMILLRPMPR